MLGLGITANKYKNNKYIGPLDKTKNYDNLVLGFSLYRLAYDYEGFCLQVRRASDDSTLDIGFDDSGYIDIDLIESFCTGTDGFVSTWYNQGSFEDVENAIQGTNALQPKIISNGDILANGLYFYDDYLEITDYNSLQILNPPLSIYSSTYVTSHNTGFIFAKNYDLSNATMRLYHSSSGAIYALLDSTFISTTIGNTAKIICNWESTAANKFKIKGEIDENTTTKTGTLTNYTDNVIGARQNGASKSTYLRGYISTLLMFNSNEYDNYSDFVNLGL